MIKLIFAVLDHKAGFYSEMPIFQFRSVGEAKRSFSDMVNDVKADNAIAKHPEDYSLCFIGTYNPITGTFENADKIENLGTGVSYKYDTKISNNLTVVGQV